MNTPERRRRTRVPLIVLLVGLLMTMPMAAWGAWSSQAALGTTASTGTVDAPTNLQCSTEGGVLGLAQYVELTWQEPASGAPSEYHIVSHAEGETYVLGTEDGHTRSFEMRIGLLSGLLEALLTILVDGGRPPITVHAVHDSGWHSPATDPIRIQLGLLGLGGLRCA